MLDEESAVHLADLWTRRLDGDISVDEEVEDAVVMMGFTASAAVQWAFITAAIDRARSEDTLGSLAAGPVERLLGKHGDEYIDRVEAEAARNPKFAQMMTGVWRYMMNDAVWARVELIKAKAVQ